MNLKIDEVWLRRMAEQEDCGPLSVGDLYYRKENEMEQVLVFPAELIDGFKSDAPEGILTDAKKIYAYLKRALYSGKTSYMARPDAEKDPTFKQVIPYTVFVRHPGEVFCYQRTKKGGESRLHDLWSLGVGGHVNPVDGVVNDRDTYWAAFRRELKEEVKLDRDFLLAAPPAPIIGLIYDDSNEVGKVHFGVVHLYKVPEETVITAKEAALANGTWVNMNDQAVWQGGDRKFETWSELVIKHTLIGVL